jgi:hypothetical protein
MKGETGSLVKSAHLETHRASVLPPHNGENVRKVPVMYLARMARLPDFRSRLERIDIVARRLAATEDAD